MGDYSDKNVVITGRSQATLDTARERLGGTVVTVRGNITPLSDLGALADRVKGEFGTLDALWVNAGITRTMPGVVLTTSIANVIGMAEASVYAAGKAALRSMARSLSRELLPRGIRVNAVSPGPIDTGILETMMTEEAAEQFTAQRVAENPMRRFGTPGEIAGAAAFLAFDATYTTGAELVVDGGASRL